jgi:hypothetical protein
MLRDGDLEMGLVLKEELAALRSLLRKYRNHGMDLADACFVRMSEVFIDSIVYTVGKTDFSVYRRHGWRPIRCEFPE